eukprot:scaffold37773_cov44-Phaeocystis_antarctica.AAC.1
MSKALAVALAQPSEPTGERSLDSRNRCAASTWCPELESATHRLEYATGPSGFRVMASRKALATLRQSCLEACRMPSVSSSSYLSPDCAAYRACRSAASRSCCYPPLRWVSKYMSRF